MFLAVTLIPAVGICQSLGYADADNPSEAVGMMQTTMLTARIMKEECIKRFPELTPQLDGNLSKWQAKEADAIRKSNFYWAQMVKKDPSAAKQMPMVEAAVRKGLTAVSEMPSEAGTKTFSNTCTQHFSALASGIWRTRTPNAYKYLDSAP
ncbi:hypothetical protein [Undibacterium sp. Xuan67W]|uniref:hypothetical protein n=1 Tax=Undibacterium sp. Xuan67W TaxID=3413057 RepID=UPI003BF1B46F